MKMDATACTRIERQLAGYVAGELDPRGIADVERHLAACPACRDELAREYVLRKTLASLPVVPCPERVTGAILAAVDGNSRGTASASRRTLPAGRWRAAAGLAAAAVAIVLLLAAPWRDRPEVAEVAVRGDWSEEEIETARGEIRLTLVLTARIIGRTERRTVDEVFGHRLPEAVTRSVKTLTTYLEGGQG